MACSLLKDKDFYHNPRAFLIAMKGSERAREREAIKFMKHADKKDGKCQSEYTSGVQPKAGKRSACRCLISRLVITLMKILSENPHLGRRKIRWWKKRESHQIWPQRERENKLLSLLIRCRLQVCVAAGDEDVKIPLHSPT
jgi:hypothetical protein